MTLTLKVFAFVLLCWPQAATYTCAPLRLYKFKFSFHAPVLGKISSVFD